VLHHEIQKFFESIQVHDLHWQCDCKDVPAWPEDCTSQMVFQEDTGAQLGGPLGSLAITALYDDVVDGRLTVVGTTQIKKQSVWGRLTLVKTEMAGSDDFYTFTQALTLVPVKHNMEGVMMRIQPSEYKEWIRIHKNYTGAHTLVDFGSRMYMWYAQFAWVKAVELVFINTTTVDLQLLEPIASKHKSIMKAFDKRMNEHLKECDNCDNSSICKEINALL